MKAKVEGGGYATWGELMVGCCCHSRVACCWDSCVFAIHGSQTFDGIAPQLDLSVH